MNPKQLKKMMQQAQAMQQKMEEEMAQLVIESSSGGGMVSVEMDGKKNIKTLRIDPQAVDPEDMDMLQDLIVAAVNEANRKVDEAMNEQMGSLGAGLLGGL